MVATTLMMAVVPALSALDVTIDGRKTRLPAGATADSVMSEGIMVATAGDFVDVTGEPLIKGAGDPAELLRDGTRLRAQDRLFEGDELTSQNGADIVEDTSVLTTTIPAPVQYEGEGPLEEVETTGTPGVEKRVVGAISRKTLSTRIVRQPSPMVVRRSSPRRTDKVVALTFDDGPWPGQTELILEILEKEDIKATFFMIGMWAKKYPAIARKVAEAGHQIGNHSYSHRNLAAARNGTLEREISFGQKAVRRATGVNPTWFRAPGGNMSSTAAKEVRAAGLRIVTWSVDPQDWRKPKPGPLARKVIREVEPGSVILLHDGGGDRSATIRALPWIIHNLQREGYDFVTLDELRKKQK
ncbi:MAG: polysaccharide deacetylase family protein [Coriobacteriia bacterium]|nr:polysaccharide deacetylase family protein [Coriobacteriia bacterium]